MECIVCVVSLFYFQWAEGYGVYCVCVVSLFYFQWAEGYGVYCVCSITVLLSVG